MTYAGRVRVFRREWKIPSLLNWIGRRSYIRLPRLLLMTLFPCNLCHLQLVNYFIFSYGSLE